MSDENDLIHALAGMISQNCQRTSLGFNSGFLTYHAEAIRVMCSLGAMKLIYDASTRSPMSQRDVTAVFEGGMAEIYGTGESPS